jgi:DNA-directed RNA polymerase subunit RPC12/RpoP
MIEFEVIDDVKYPVAEAFYRLDSTGKGTPNVSSYKCPVCRVHSKKQQFILNNIGNENEKFKQNGIYKCPFCNQRIILK